MSWILFLLFCLSVFSQEYLPGIEVRAEKELEEFNFSTSSVLKKEELHESPTTLVAPKLSSLPGVISSQSGGPGSRTSFFLRGTDSRHVAFALDGLKLNDPSNVDRQFDAAFISAAHLKSLEVFRGPQAVLFGSDAMGGLVDMKTRKGEDAPETRVTFGGGSFGTVEGSLSSDWKTAKNRGTLSWGAFRTDGISRLNKKRFHATERDSSEMTQLTSSSHHEWKSKWDSDLLLSFVKGNSEYDNSTQDSHNRSFNDQYIAQIKTNYSLGSSRALSLRNGLSRHDRTLKDETFGPSTYAGDMVQHELLYRQEEKKASWILGAMTEHQDFRSSFSKDSDFDLHSGFLQTAWKEQTWKWQGGLRHDYHTKYEGFNTGSTGLSKNFGAAVLGFQYSQGFKAPSLYQIWDPLYGNRSLVPEQNKSLELVWTYKSSQVESSLTLFQNRLANLLTFNQTSGYFNQGRFITEGVEVSSKLRGSNFEVAPQFTHQEFRDYKATVLNRPKNYGQLTASFFPTGSTELFVRGKWFGSRISPLANNTAPDFAQNIKLSSYETFDLGLKLAQGKSVYGVQLLNLFDREYEELAGYGVLARSIFFNYGHTF